MSHYDSKAMNVENGMQDKKKLESEKMGQTPKRETWGNKAEFLLSCIGLAVGIGNVWRFPYLAYENGGGAFLLAYIIMLVIVGKPHFFAELALGQFAGVDTLSVWKCIPIAKGVGVAMIILSVMVAIYYNVIMCYTLYYVVQSFRSQVPWKECSSWWGADSNCYVRTPNMTTCNEGRRDLTERYMDWSPTNGDNTSVPVSWKDKVVMVPLEAYSQALDHCINATQTASEQFWERYVLHLTSGIDELGTVKWDLALTLFICWIIVYLGLMKGIKTSGKIVYVTATSPYLILIVLVVYGCTLPGALNGLAYFFIPDWKKLLEIQVWRAAVEQLLFSLSLGWGALIVNASYNKFHNNIYKDAVIVSVLDFMTSLMAGIVIFAVLGNLATEMAVDISKVAKEGQGLAFVAYPEALARLPVSQLWSALFFFMLFLLAIDSEFSYLENFFTAVYDHYPSLKKRKMLITFAVCMLFFCLGLPCVTEGGQYVFNLMDTYGGGYAGVLVATCEIVFLMWGYGADRFADDIEYMIGFRPGLYWRMCWKYISPVVLLFVVIYSMTQHKPIKYGSKPYPQWAESVGWVLVMLSVAQIPLWAIIEAIKHRKNLRRLFQPHPDWGPSDPDVRRLYYLKYPPTSGNYPESQHDNKGEINLGMDPINEDFR